MLPEFPSCRREALIRWHDFRPALADYSRRRNFVEVGHGNVSRLSPAIRCRLITEEELLASIRGQVPFPKVEKFVQELLWRCYWKAWLENNPHVWSAYRAWIESAENRLSGETRRRIENVQQGRSGVAVMDRFARELIETGYLHNHARMWWASFWIHVERLPWQVGADFFRRHLLDFDPASNTLSWRWVAGLQTRGKIYRVRRDNIQHYLSPNLFDPIGLDQLDTTDSARFPIHDSDEVPAVSVRVTRDQPLLGDHRWGLWLHEEDLAPETGGFPSHPPAKIFANMAGGPDGDSPFSSVRREYLRQALTDGLQRTLAFWKLSPDRVELVTGCSRAESMGRWSQREKLDAIWAMRPFIGTLNDELPAIATSVRTAGAKLILLDRTWDESFRPHALRGYFSFWEKARKEIAW
jgi:deoxyribodipyrimidine photo-lyase